MSVVAYTLMPSPELVRLTRNALSHLYDAAYLENHSLALALDTTAKLDHVTRAQRLRRLLLDCIESLRPQQHDGSVPEAARAYAILTYRYIDGMTMEEIAAKRALSERQAYRELERGLEAVAALVHEHLGESGLSAALVQPANSDAPDSQLHLAQVEVARLRQTVHAEPLNPQDVFEAVLTMLLPLRERLGSRVDILPSEASWPLIVADRVMLRQGLLNLLTYAIHAVAPGDLSVTADRNGNRLRIDVREARARDDLPRPLPSSEPDRLRLIVAEALVAAQGGRLEIISDPDGWCARLWFPIVARKTILVVDDNVDLIALFQRYLGGHEVAVIGATESAQALRLAAELQPDVITLDVMMPNLDGWDVLQRLKSGPETTHIPVVVCSVLHEIELAQNLGANDYLTKPVQQADLLSVLGPYLLQPALAP